MKPTLRLAVLTSIILCSVCYAQSGDIKIIGTVLDPAGAVVPNVRVRIIASNGSASETLTDADGRFELSSRTKSVTLVAEASGFDRFERELKLTENRVEEVDVRLMVGCLPEIEHLIPKKLDLRRFFVEIRYTGAFGDCPEKVYRLWGTGQASITYFACGGKTFRASRLIKPAFIASALAKLAKKHSGRVCSVYPGGIDAPRVELTIISGSERRILITHDQADNVQDITPLEREIEKLVDPESRMQSFPQQERTNVIVH